MFRNTYTGCRGFWALFQCFPRSKRGKKIAFKAGLLLLKQRRYSEMGRITLADLQRVRPGSKKYKRLQRIHEKQVAEENYEKMSNRVSTDVPEGVDELDLRVNVPLQLARRVLTEDSKAGARARTAVREAAGLGKRFACPIVVIPGDQAPQWEGERSKSNGLQGWQLRRMAQRNETHPDYTPSTLKVTVGADWVLKHLEK